MHKNTWRSTIYAGAVFALELTASGQLYTYDTSGRLQQTDLPDLRRTTYEYDAAANLSRVAQSIPFLEPAVSNSPGVSRGVKYQVNLASYLINTPLKYQWFLNAALIPEATEATLVATAPGTYSVRVFTEKLYGTTLAAGTISAPEPTSTYEGTYFGVFPDGGSWALQKEVDRPATYIAFLPDRSTAIAVSLNINADGTFSVSGGTLSASGVVSAGATRLPPVAAATLPFTLSGKISNGQVTGGVLGKTLIGAVDQGSNQGSGSYRASALFAENGTTYLIAGPSGKALVVIVTPTFVDGIVGTMDSTGRLSAATSGGAQLAATVSQASRTFAATYTGVGSGKILRFSGLQDAVRPNSALANLSIRSAAGRGDLTLIVGFAKSGIGKRVLIRGIGPALAGFGVTGYLTDPKLDLLRSSSLVASNDNWSPVDAAVFTQVGAFALTPGSRDAAIVTTLDSISYSAQVSDTGGATGIALMELYDAAFDNGARLVNVSARSQVGTGGGILIAGFNVSGVGPLRLLIRGIGPSLTGFGVAGVLVDPQMTLFASSNGAVTAVASNDNWDVAVAPVFSQVGAFNLSTGSKDAVLLATLEPGTYTVQVSGVGNTTGIALVEIYEVP